MRARIFTVIVLTVLVGCGSIVGDRVTVRGTGAGELLKLRAGPGLGYSVVLGLPDGTALNRADCVTEVGQRWCRVTLADAPNLTGYVAADYLTEN